MTVPIPTSNHNQALVGDTLYSAFLNYEWRQIVLPYVIRGMEELAATIEDEGDRQAFEALYGAMIDDFYNEDVMDNTPVAAITAFVGLSTSIPAKWLLCDGTLYDGADYPDLYAALDDIFKDGFGNFTVPDMQDRFLLGSGINDNVGELGGANQHTLTTAEIPSHLHVVPAHNHTFPTYNNTAHDQNFVWGVRATSQIGTGTVSTQPATDTSAVGGGAAHNNMPAYIAVHWIIKALP